MASTAIPKTMKGVVIGKTGGVEVLEYKTDLPVPEPKEGEVLVKNDFIGVNFIDIYFRIGLYPAPKPQILGREGEGTIVSLGPSGNYFDFQPGDRVLWIGSGGGSGGYAEYSTVVTTHVVKIPSEIPPSHASAAALQGLTALTLVDETTQVKKGDWVLVHAAAGGTGGWLCQILKAKGVHTIATAGTEEKRNLALKSGAEVAVGYGEEEVLQAVMEKTGGEGVRAVFDGVGKTTFDLSLKTLARKGFMCSFGNASGAVEPLTIGRLSAKNIKLARPSLFPYITTREEYITYADELFKLMIHDKFDVKIHNVYALSDAAKAQTDLEGRHTTGKLLLKP